MQFVVRKNWLNSVKMVCSLSVRGHHSYHFNLLTYVVLFCSFLLNSAHRCCQDFPLYISDGFMPGLAPCLSRAEPLWPGRGGSALGAAMETGSEAGMGMGPTPLRHGIWEIQGRHWQGIVSGVPFFSGEVGIPWMCSLAAPWLPQISINAFISVEVSCLLVVRSCDVAHYTGFG